MLPFEHALICLLWSEYDENGEPLDSSDVPVSESLLATIRGEWEDFRNKAEALGFDANEHCARMLHPDCEGDAWNAAAHDFILTRNGHGTGFWDPGRWCAPWGEKLTVLCRKFGSINAYQGDDGLLYCEQGG